MSCQVDRICYVVKISQATVGISRYHHAEQNVNDSNRQTSTSYDFVSIICAPTEMGQITRPQNPTFGDHCSLGARVVKPPLNEMIKTCTEHASVPLPRHSGTRTSSDEHPDRESELRRKESGACTALKVPPRRATTKAPDRTLERGSWSSFALWNRWLYRSRANVSPVGFDGYTRAKRQFLAFSTSPDLSVMATSNFLRGL